MPNFVFIGETNKKRVGFLSVERINIYEENEDYLPLRINDSLPLIVFFVLIHLPSHEGKVKHKIRL